MKSLIKVFVSAAFVLTTVVGSLGVAATQVACSGKTCSDSEEKSCTDTYTACVNEAAASGDRKKCESCVDNYCKCYDSCGNSCDRDKLNASCPSAPSVSSTTPPDVGPPTGSGEPSE